MPKLVDPQGEYVSISLPSFPKLIVGEELADIEIDGLRKALDDASLQRLQIVETVYYDANPEPSPEAIEPIVQVEPEPEIEPEPNPAPEPEEKPAPVVEAPVKPSRKARGV